MLLLYFLYVNLFLIIIATPDSYGIHHFTFFVVFIIK